MRIGYCHKFPVRWVEAAESIVSRKLLEIMRSLDAYREGDSLHQIRTTSIIMYPANK